MADNFPEQSESELKKKFKEAWKLFREIEKNESPSNSPDFQVLIHFFILMVIKYLGVIYLIP